MKVKAAVLGGELLCNRFGDDVDAARLLPEGTNDRPQDPALVAVEAELGVEAAVYFFYFFFRPGCFVFLLSSPKH